MEVVDDSSHSETKSGWTRSAQDAAETQDAELSSALSSGVTPKTSGVQAAVPVTNRRSRGISSSPTCIDVRYTFQPPPSKVVPALLLTASVLIAGQFVFVAIMLAVLLALLAINYASIRLTADEGGVRVMNWGGSTLLAWSEISEIELGRSWGSQIIEISLWNGKKAKPWATRTGAMGGYPYEQMDRVAQRLQVMLRGERGIKDPPALAEALAAAEDGDPQPLDQLLASGTIDRATYSRRLHELADEGKLDLEALRQVRRDEL
jgi:hypothetical protein